MLAALEQPTTEVRGEARQVVEQRTAVLRSSIVVGQPARVVGGVAMVEPRDAAQLGPRGEASHEARLAQQGGRPFHAPKWPPSAVGDPARTTVGVGPKADMDPAYRARPVGSRPASWTDAHRRVRPRTLLRPMGVRGRAPAVRLGPRGLSDGGSCSTSPTTRPARLWDRLTLGYTESTGHPLLRREIAGLYDGIEPDDVLVFAGAEEGIFCLMNVPARSGRPRDRDLARLPEPVRDRPGGRRRCDAPRAARGRPAGRSISTCCAPAATRRHEAHRRQCPAQPDRDAARPGHLRRARADRRGRRRAPPHGRGLPVSSSSTRPIGCRPAPTPWPAASRSA